MIIKKIFFSYLCLLVTLVAFGSEKCPISYLELFPNQGLKPVALGHKYYSMTAEDKKLAIFLPEGTYTILEKNQCALVGPLQPCQLFTLTLPNKHMVVAHISAQSKFALLLQKIKNCYPDIDFSQSIAELFTNKSKCYNDNILKIPGDKEQSISYHDVYGKSQLEELKYNKDLVCNILKMPRENVKALLFTSQYKDFELGAYEEAELFTFIKEGNTYNTCPIGENYIGNDQLISNPNLVERVRIVNQWIARYPNPFFLQPEIKTFLKNNQYPPYDSLLFVKKDK